MRKLFLLSVAVVFALGLSASAGAATLQLTSSSLDLGVGPLPPVPFPGSATPLVNVSSGSGAFTVPSNIFVGVLVLPTQLFTGVPLINGLVLDLQGNAPIPLQTNAVGGGQTEHIVRPGGGLGADGPLAGTAFVNVFFLFNLDVPLGVVGQSGGFATAMGADIAISVYGTGWTTGSVQLTDILTATPETQVVNTVTYAGFDNRTAGHAGQLLLVSPFKVAVAGLDVPLALPGIALMTLNFVAVVPEPGTLLLLGSGIAGLFFLGRRRMRK